MNFKKTSVAIILFVSFYSIGIISQVRLPKLISDGMIIQRDEQVKIWGWASTGELVSVLFLGSEYQATANENGEWNIILPKFEAGGPYEMKINARNSITIKDVMIGDVWICSGQSNMELPMRRVSWVYPNEIANSENKYIRQLLVPDKYDFNEPQKDLESGSWISANPKSVLDFSAVAYFFAKEIYDRYKVPIGLINSSLGGSPAEAWMSVDALRKFPKYYNEAQMYKNAEFTKKTEDFDKARISVWHSILHYEDEGYGDSQKFWYDPEFNTADWATMKVPGYWKQTDLENLSGVVWFRKKINLPLEFIQKNATLVLGRIIDSDSVFVNEKFVGTTGYEWPPRRYAIPAGLLRQGENTIVVRVISSASRGGFVPDKDYIIVADDDTIDVSGDWQYRLGTQMVPLASQTFIRWKPLGLFNAMIAPLLNYKIKGVIWYQGEGNATRPHEYHKLFSAMIKDWQQNWNQGDFPFLFVQLASFMEKKDQPSESDWALLREAQLKTLSVPNTAMAVTIDIGEWNDIHPLNKKDVGKRLAFAAKNLAYGEKNILYSGPIYESMRIDGNKIILSFSNTGSSLIAKGGGELKYFSIAGSDKNFVWAEAKIENDKVVVWNDSISNPIAVRYAWADTPDGANLFNKEGLPASPFRTDDF